MKLKPLRLHIARIDQLSPIPAMPVDIERVKAHCRIDAGNDALDDLAEFYLRAAVEWAEGAMDRTIVARPHRWVLREFPADEYQDILLPRGRTKSVESVQYSVGGSLTTLYGPSSATPGTSYQEDLQSLDGATLMPSRGASWPTVDADVPAPAIINFTAGYDFGAVPEDIMHALMFAVSDCFELPGSSDIPQAVSLSSAGSHLEIREMLVSGYRLHRIY